MLPFVQYAILNTDLYFYKNGPYYVSESQFRFCGAIILKFKMAAEPAMVNGIPDHKLELSVIIVY